MQVHDVSPEEGEGPNFELLEAVDYWEVPIQVRLRRTPLMSQRLSWVALIAWMRWSNDVAAIPSHEP